MGKSIAEMLDSMDLEEYLSWKSYELVEPFGASRADLAVAKPIAALMSLSTKSSIKPSALMPDYEARYREKKAEPTATQQHFIQCIGGVVNGPR